MFKNTPTVTQPIYKQVYSGFRGVDMTSAPTECDATRSPNGINMIAYENGAPQKRTGYALQHDYGARINGLHEYVTKESAVKLIVHAGTKVYLHGETPQLIHTAAADAKSSAFVYDNKFFLLDGKRLMMWDGTGSMSAVDTQGYVPTTTIQSKATGGGIRHEAVNLMSGRSICSFLVTSAEAGATVFQLDRAPVTGIVKCEKLNANGTWSPITAYTLDAANGRVTFASAIGASPVNQEDNLKIELMKPAAADKINGCTITTQYGIGNDLRVFASGNPKWREYDWHTGPLDPTYWPDDAYALVGSESGAIMGYLKQYENLIIVKEYNAQDACLFSRSATVGENGDVLFLVQQGIAGVGAISKHCFASLGDDNIFLTREGVFGLDTDAVSKQRSVQLRSYYVNGVLCAEENLHEAVAVVHGGRYYLCVNGRVYLADSNQQNTNPAGSRGYEWYFWENVPARCAVVHGDAIWIGSEQGKVYAFRHEAENGAYADDGKPIYACWATRADALGDASGIKRIMKNNTGVTVMPFMRSSGVILYITGSTGRKIVKEYQTSTAFDCTYVDCVHFELGMLPYPYFVPTRKKESKVQVFQILVENGKLDEGFGLYDVVVSYIPTKPIKR